MITQMAVPAPQSKHPGTTTNPCRNHPTHRLVNCSHHSRGGMCERLKQAVLKTAIPERVSGVRIPLPPPELFYRFTSCELRFFDLSTCLLSFVVKHPCLRSIRIILPFRAYA